MDETALETIGYIRHAEDLAAVERRLGVPVQEITETGALASPLRRPVHYPTVRAVG